MMRWLCALVVAGAGLTLAGRADAKSSLNLEVREATKARLVSADVLIKTLKGALVSKAFAAAGRLNLANAPLGTFNLEARSRQGNLVGTTRVVIKPNAVVRAVVTIRPGPAPAKVVSMSKAPPPRIQPGATKTAPPPLLAQPGPAATPRPSTVKPIGGVTPLAPPAKDWSKGKSHVCRGDVFDLKGRRISGKLQLFLGLKAIGVASVVSGYFSLFDLASGTYQLRFTSSDGKHKVNTNAAIVAGKLAKVVLKAP